jgi:hypothetical protein
MSNSQYWKKRYAASQLMADKHEFDKNNKTTQEAIQKLGEITGIWPDDELVYQRRNT